MKVTALPIVRGPGRHPPSGSVFLYVLDPDGLTVEYSYGMEEFPEQDARVHRVLPLAPESIDTWGSITDRRLGAVGEIEVDGDNLEAMALENASPIMYVDNRGKNEVDVINRQTHAMVATWPVTLGKTMVALVLDEASHRLFVGCRDGHIVVFDLLTGKEIQAISIGMGIDDLVFDAPSKRIYAACGGSGTVDVYEEVDADHYRSLGKVPSGPLARNGLLIPSLKQYFVAVPKGADQPARILMYQVQ